MHTHCIEYWKADQLYMGEIETFSAMNKLFNQGMVVDDGKKCKGGFHEIFLQYYIMDALNE